MRQIKSDQRLKRQPTNSVSEKHPCLFFEAGKPAAGQKFRHGGNITDCPANHRGM
jgi:hypothetical protein